MLALISFLLGSMSAINEHVFNLSNCLYQHLKILCHANGQKVAEIYKEDNEISIFNHGSILNFNLLDSEGNYIGYNQVFISICFFFINE